MNPHIFSVSTGKRSGSDGKKVFRPEWILMVGLAIFLVTSILIVENYGMNVDAARNYAEGKANLDYLLSGEADKDVLKRQTQGAFLGMVAEAAKRVLHDQMGLYSPLAARHIVQPFLAVPFLLVLFYFVRRHWGSWYGLVAVGLLLTFPSFWGHTFTNQKDFPLLICFSLALMSFVEWVATHKFKYLYGFFVFWGLALAIKFYALVVPLILVLWLIIRPVRGMEMGMPPWRKTLPHLAAGIAVAAILVMVLYMPAIWVLPDKMAFLLRWQAEVGTLVIKSDKTFNITSLIQIFFRTPVLVLLFSLAGIVIAIRHYREKNIYALLLLWLFIPVIIPCFPGTTPYSNGLRLFLVFLVPWTIFAAIGLDGLACYLGGKLRVNVHRLRAGVAAAVIGISLSGIVATHPYETTFFNALAGGLGGAQAKKLPDAADYWLTSYLEAGRWINQNAAENAIILGLGFVASGHFAPAITRKDLRVHTLYYLPFDDQGVAVPANTYVIHAPMTERSSYQSMVLELSGDFQKVHQVKRQGGEIFSIYYRPPLPVWLNK